jgi:Na+/H+ antiporter NhaA
MPIFALANAGVGSMRRHWSPGSRGRDAGSLDRKPVGIFLFSWLAAPVHRPCRRGRTASAERYLAGIGFTAAIFIAGLALRCC